MGEKTASRVSRRGFLGSASAVVAAAAVGTVPAVKGQAAAASGPLASETPHKKKKIPIGVFDPAYPKLSLDEMLEKVSSLGLEAMEIGTGGYPNSAHCPVAELLADAGKAKAWKKKFVDKNIAHRRVQLPREPDPSRSQACRDRRGIVSSHGSAGGAAGRAGDRRLLRMPGRNSDRHDAELGDVPLASRVRTDA